MHVSGKLPVEKFLIFFKASSCGSCYQAHCLLKQLLLLATLANRIGYKFYINVIFIALGVKVNFVEKKTNCKIFEHPLRMLTCLINKTFPVLLLFSQRSVRVKILANLYSLYKIY